MLFALTLGMIVGIAMYYFIYLQGKFPDSLTGEGSLLREGFQSGGANRLDRLSPAGVLQVVYFGLAIAVIFMFYFCSKPTTEDILAVGVALALYSIVANHVPLALINRSMRFPWCPDIFAEESSPALIVGASLVAVIIATAVKLW